MNNLKNILNKYNIHPKSYEIKGKVLIIETNDKKYVLKQNTNNYEIYKYLSSRNFNNYPMNYNLKADNYDLSIYIESFDIPFENKIFDLIKILSILHNKTSFMEEVNLDNIKREYEELKNNNHDLLDYYTNLNDYFDNLIFLSPAAYLLMRNISIIYFLLSYANHEIDDWYQLMSKKKSKKVSLIHNNISINHLLINEHKYLISWDKSKIGDSINDLVSLYKKYYFNIELNDLINIYQEHNKLDETELKLLIIYLSIPNKIEFTNDNLNDVKMINQEITYLKKIYEYIKNSQVKT